MSSNTEELKEILYEIANAFSPYKVNRETLTKFQIVSDMLNKLEAREATLKAEYEEKIREAKLGLIDRLNKKIFYTNTNPRGQHVKDCLMGEFGNLQPKTPKKELEQDE